MYISRVCTLFQENKFQRLFHDSDWFSQDFKFHNKPFHSQYFKINSPYGLRKFWEPNCLSKADFHIFPGPVVFFNIKFQDFQVFQDPCKPCISPTAQHVLLFKNSIKKQTNKHIKGRKCFKYHYMELNFMDHSL